MIYFAGKYAVNAGNAEIKNNLNLYFIYKVYILLKW